MSTPPLRHYTVSLVSGSACTSSRSPPRRNIQDKHFAIASLDRSPGSPGGMCELLSRRSSVSPRYEGRKEGEGEKTTIDLVVRGTCRQDTPNWTPPRNWKFVLFISSLFVALLCSIGEAGVYRQTLDWRSFSYRMLTIEIIGENPFGRASRRLDPSNIPDGECLERPEGNIWEIYTVL